MNTPHSDSSVVPFAKLRRGLEIMYPSVQHKPMIHGLFEVDVTKARTLLQEHKENTGESLSFTAFILHCFAHVINEDTSVQACRKGRRHLMLFDAVDVALPVERVIAGTMQPIIYIVRDANMKTLRDIHCEIREAQTKQVETISEGFAATYWLRFLPMVLLRFVWWIFCWMRRTYPRVQKKYGGTVGISNVGMFSHTAGWGIPLNDHTLDLTLGGIATKPGVVDGHLAIREYLCITISMNHAIIDGAPAARFARRLQELIESGYGLDESAPGEIAARVHAMR